MRQTRQRDADVIRWPYNPILNDDGHDAALANQSTLNIAIKHRCP